MAAKTLANKACLFCYLVLLEVFVCGVLGLAIFCMNFEPIEKLRIWQQFDGDMRSLPPILVIVAALVTILAPIPGVAGAVKNNQMIIALFVGLMVVSVFLWFGIGSWIISLHNVVIGGMEIQFQRIREYGQTLDGDDQAFLRDLSENMPRLTHKTNFMCCQQVEDVALDVCAEECGRHYKSLFEVVIFPVLYATLFGTGGLCLLSLVFACLLCRTLDDVNPSF